MQNDPIDLVPYEGLDEPGSKVQVREYILATCERIAIYRDSKETRAVGGPRDLPGGGGNRACFGDVAACVCEIVAFVQAARFENSAVDS